MSGEIVRGIRAPSLLSIIKKTTPSAIAHDIISVQPMSPGPDPAWFSTNILIGRKVAKNADGIFFSFITRIEKDETKKILAIRVDYYSQDKNAQIEVIQLVSDVTGLNEEQTIHLAKMCLAQYVEQIDALTIEEHFNKIEALKILEANKHTLNTVGKRDDK